MTLLLIPICIATNIVGGQVAHSLKLPIFLDVIGTILAGALAGPVVGAATGLVSSVINSIADPIFMPYALVAMAVGLVAGFLSRKAMFADIKKIILSIVIITAVSLIVTAPITAYIFGGISSSGSSFFTALLLASGQELMPAVLLSQLPLELIDKALSTVLAVFIISRLPERYLIKLPLGKTYVKNAAKSGE